MLDKNNIKVFWEKRSSRSHTIPYEAIGNLEENRSLLALKIQQEKEAVMSRISLNPDMHVLDLGAGVGQWALRFAPFVRKVTAVEYTSTFIEIGKKEAQLRKIDNVEWVKVSAEKFKSKEQFDFIFISGLLIYMSDGQAAQVVHGLRRMVKKGGIVFIRDGTSVLTRRYLIADKYSEELQAPYSALYRTKREYIELFQNRGFNYITDGDMFPDGSPLNKHLETKLRFYIFRRGHNVR